MLRRGLVVCVSTILWFGRSTGCRNLGRSRTCDGGTSLNLIRSSSYALIQLLFGFQEQALRRGRDVVEHMRVGFNERNAYRCKSSAFKVEQSTRERGRGHLHSPLVGTPNLEVVALRRVQAQQPSGSNVLGSIPEPAVLPWVHRDTKLLANLLRLVDACRRENASILEDDDQLFDFACVVPGHWLQLHLAVNAVEVAALVQHCLDQAQGIYGVIVNGRHPR
mmetsp:Transcript_90268/g.254742  ORF Transcript_90268/g.254742 Transcript_90268/m.254742 type:complete len:221 (-) Transcript_90268:1465-2127(-)